MKIFLLGWLFAGLFLPLHVQAQGQSTVMYDTPGGRIPTELATGPYNEWLRTTTATPTGVNSSATGTAMVTAPNGTRIPVPVTATATIPQSALAKAAAKRAAAAALGPAGAAYTAATVAEELLDPGDANSEWIKCGFMDLFLCKRPENTGGAPIRQFRWQSTEPWSISGDSVCYGIKAWNPEGLTYFASMSGTTHIHSCFQSVSGSWVWRVSLSTRLWCANGTAPDTSKPLSEQCGVVAPADPVPATEEEIEQSLQEKMDADYEAGRRLWEALKADQAAAQAAGAPFPADHDPVNADTPVSVDAPPVTSPERTTKVDTRTNPDGSTDTATTKEKTTVEPQTTGSKYGDTKTTFPSKTTVTTTTVNNVTNNTTVNTTVVNNEAAQEKKQDNEDYTFADSAFPEVPELYTQKYPDGIAGVWRDHKPNIQGTQFWAGIQQMFPSFGTGQCPAWSMSFNLGAAGNFGTIPFDVPCWIFQAVGLILMTTAAFTARKIIF